MAKYEVVLHAEADVVAYVVVDADSEEQAEDKARCESRHITWSIEGGVNPCRITEISSENVASGE
jgi:hypothetical protein